ncbi:MAG: hypothetical protein VYA11_02330 [Planctomycetota bacterium]|nr:hypothetical protein [Planctomycetota bacterium]
MFPFCPETRPGLPETRSGRLNALRDGEGLLGLRFIAWRPELFFDPLCAEPTGRPEDRKSVAPVLSRNRLDDDLG